MMLLLLVWLTKKGRAVKFAVNTRNTNKELQPIAKARTSLILAWSISANGDGQWTNTEFGASASVYGASASEASASRASAIRERDGALNMDGDPLALVDVVVDDDDDDDDGNSRAHKIHYDVRPMKKAKTSRGTMDDWMVYIQFALRHIVKTTDGPTTKQSREMREMWMKLPSEPDVLKGWIELTSVAHDSRILSEAIRNQNAPFPLPPPGDFRRRRALNSKEKFNHSHAKLRNVIERAYGVLKTRFPILKRMTPFSLTTQRNITIACFALHNFIRKEGLDEEIFSTYDKSNVQLDNENVLVEDDGGIEDDEVVQPQRNASDRQYMTNLRD
ncbi:Myb/SANT-like domain, harbinger transposase-derived nuclease domain protein [Tanacetum coccineum]